MKTWLTIIALALLASLVVPRSRPDEPFAADVSDTFQGPSFAVHVVRPLSARPFFGLFGLLPDNELRFDHTSRGARIGSVGHDHLELSADGWNLFIETDGEGRVAPGTRLVFPIELDGSFLVELATCKNAESGKAIEWPPEPLTVSGSFGGLPTRGSLETKGDRPKAQHNPSSSS